ncbi:uncharacterized protein BDCG_17963 [Blastomyces dermatitidis ER-3]|uniref:Protein NO VEIN C-terminal domain-containing protein n=1 Tax=Ajellomyces dermatitidis (strain ER-3 / ATCC MYA-2586) TaxID=559297 RepID=A0ABX2W1A7_AJEDR|nr:uncharacterized protein BDCG_17963 [Blastomyces dermatitidis ER-3]OAT03175.1 hypothetical protein BDCG_17963 [Blastomyces dermatitidis ER-3]
MIESRKLLGTGERCSAIGLDVGSLGGHQATRSKAEVVQCSERANGAPGLSTPWCTTVGQQPVSPAKLVGVGSMPNSSPKYRRRGTIDCIMLDSSGARKYVEIKSKKYQNVHLQKFKWGTEQFSSH